MTTDDEGQAPPADQPDGTNQPPPPAPNPQAAEIFIEEAKVLLHSAGTGTTNVFLGSADDSKKASLDGLVENLPPLASGIRLFRDPRHNQMRDELEQQRLLLLSSYQESAAYAAANSLAQDAHFSSLIRTVFFPRRGREKDRSDLDLFALADEQFLGQHSQILLIDIDGHCPLIDSALRDMSPLMIGSIQTKLQRHGSYVIFVVNEELVANRTTTARIPCHSVSHLRYLLDPTGRAEDFERRVLSAVAFAAGSMEMRELYQRVADRLDIGVDAFEEFLLELETARSLPLSTRKPVTPEDIFPEESETHRAATFVATYFPDIGQRDFDRLVLTLLADQTVTIERSRQVVGRDGTVSSVREQVQEAWADRWIRSADRVFRECHLRTIAAADGAWLVDFSEPYLRRELRAYFERHNAWYLKRQCQILQERGVLFAVDLSPVAVETLVRLFVERAVVDPVGFGTVWLLDLVHGLRIQLSGNPPDDSPEEVLAWLLEQVATEAQFRAHFYGRLALLIREMLDREPLRRMVRDFFEYLIAARQHDALLGVVLDLARRLRFAPHFDPLFWMRRLLDQGSSTVRERTAARLITLARDSGPRIYEFLTTIRTWLPEPSRTPDRFSMSNRVALDFPFAYCLAIAAALPEDRFGLWPSHHPLFYALPADTAEARKEIGKLADWITRPQGAATEVADPTDPTLIPEARRIAAAGDLIEHWAWVLEGAMNEGHSEGRALFRVIAEEIDRRLGVNERIWLQRSWKRRKDNYVTKATSSTGDQRKLLINRRVRLEQLWSRFVQAPQTAP
jgi:hypothetical protein